MNSKRTGYVVSVVVSLLLSLMLLCSALLSTPGGLFYFMNPENIGMYGNITIYLLTGGVFILTFVLLSLAVKHDIFPDLSISPRARSCVVIGCLILTAVVVYLLYEVLYCKYFVMQTLSSLGLLIVAAVITAASVAILYYEKGDFNKNWALYAIYGVIAVILGLTVVTPNIFYEGGLVFGGQAVDSGWNLHHASAYLDSIYNVLQGQPYTGGQTDQYGHYGLFLYIPLKLFGGSTLTVSVIMGILMALSALFLMGAVHVSLRSNYLKALVAIAGGLCLAACTVNYIYWQVLPHRVIFPALMVFVVALYARKDSLTKKEYAIGSLISMLAVLWNFESGIAAAAAWFMFIIIKYYQNNDFNVRSFAKKLLVMAAALGLYIIVPFLIVNLYNLFVTGFDTGSLLSVGEFIGAMLDSGYFVQLNSKWTFGSTPIEFMMFLFLICIAWALLSTSILSKKGKPSIPAIAAASISIAGLVLLTKCVNNTGGVPVEVWLFVAAALGLLASQMIWEIKNIKEWKSFDLCRLVKVPVCSLALIGLVMMGTYGVDIGNVASPLHSDHEGFVSFTDEIEGSVPKDTLAVGEGTAAIYMELGWDKQYYKFYSTEDELRELFSVNDSFFILLGSKGSPVDVTELTDYSQFVDLNEYHLVKGFSYCGIQYGYYERN